MGHPAGEERAAHGQDRPCRFFAPAFCALHATTNVLNRAPFMKEGFNLDEVPMGR